MKLMAENNLTKMKQEKKNQRSKSRGTTGLPHHLVKKPRKQKEPRIWPSKANAVLPERQGISSCQEPASLGWHSLTPPSWAENKSGWFKTRLGNQNHLVHQPMTCKQNPHLKSQLHTVPGSLKPTVWEKEGLGKLIKHLLSEALIATFCSDDILLSLLAKMTIKVISSILPSPP